MSNSKVSGPMRSQNGFITPATGTFAALPAASTVEAGTSVNTTDHGIMVSDGVHWVPQDRKYDIVVGKLAKFQAAKLRQKANPEQPARILITGESTLSVGAGDPNDPYFGTTDGRPYTWPVLLANKMGWQDCSAFADQNDSVELGGQTLNGYDRRLNVTGGWGVTPYSQAGLPVYVKGSTNSDGSLLTVTEILNSYTQSSLYTANASVGSQMPPATPVIRPNMQVYKADGTSLGGVIGVSVPTFVSGYNSPRGQIGTYVPNGFPKFTANLASQTLVLRDGKMFAGHPWYAAAGAAGSLTFTPGKPITRFRVWYAAKNSDTLLYPKTTNSLGIRCGTVSNPTSIINTTVSTRDGSNDWANDAALPTAWFSVPKDSSYVISLTNPGDSHAIVYGIEAYDHTNPNPSVMITGWSGGPIAVHVQYSYGFGTLNTYRNMAPDLTLIHESGNDEIQNTNPDEYASYLNTLAKNVAASGDVITMGCYGIGYNGDVGFYASLLPSYQNTMKQVALSTGGSFASIGHLFSTNPYTCLTYWNDGAEPAYYIDNTVSYNMFDTAHPNKIGHAQMADYYTLLGF